MGASTMKYTTPSSCMSLRESDSKLYNNFEFYEGKYQKHLENTLIYKAKNFFDNLFLKKSLHILEDNASSVQVDILSMWLSRIC